MSYADSLLTPGERVVLRARQHWLIVVRAVALRDPRPAPRRRCCSYVLAVVNGSSADRSRSWAGSRSSSPSSASADRRLAACWRSTARSTSLTNRRLIKADGVINKHSADSSLEKINDAVLTRAVLRPDARLRRPRHPDAAGAAIERLRQLRQPTASSRRCSTRSTSSSWSGRAPTMPPHPDRAAGRGTPRRRSRLRRPRRRPR